MNKLLVAAVRADAVLEGIIGDRFWKSGALGTGQIPADPETPYAMYRITNEQEHQSVRETGRPKDLWYQFYVYDDRGSYTRIDDALDRMRETVRGIRDLQEDPPSGPRCMEVVWLGRSGEMEEGPPTHRFVRFGTAKITASS